MKAKQIRDVLRLHYENGLSQNEIQRTSRVSKGSVHNTLARIQKLGMDYEEFRSLSDDELIKTIYPGRKQPPPPDSLNLPALLDELARPAVTIQLLWEEYRKNNPDGIGRSSFYAKIREANAENGPDPSMHRIHKGGRYLEVDYSGLRSSYFDVDKGKEVEVEIFIASWSASSYVYAEATPSQTKEDWIASNVRALRFFGCCPDYIVPDNLKSGVIKASFCDPELNRTYDEMARYYGTAILPARARHPKDKGNVESNVRFVQTFILGRLRDRRHTSLRDLNDSIHELLNELNDRPMQRYKVSRRERFEKVDLPNASALPNEDYSILEIQDGVRVEKDHHVSFRNHYYSVPWRLTGNRVSVWFSGTTVEIYDDGERIATHPYSKEVGGYTTNETHRPPNHQFMNRLSPVWILSQAEKIGPKAFGLIKKQIDDDPKHSDVAVRKGLGLVELAEQYSPERVELALNKALGLSRLRLCDVEGLLKQGLEGDLEGSPEEGTSCEHGNIRGHEHYKNHVQQKGG